MSNPSQPAWAFVRKVSRSWATRSLALGAVSTAIDLGLGGTLLASGAPTRTAAMAGTLVGSTFTFFANRYLVFREARPEVAAPALRFLLITLVSSVIHGQLVVQLRDRWGIPYAPAKMLADLCVFTFPQLFVLRYIVFPKRKAPTSSLSE